MNKCRMALIIVSWMVLTCPVLAMGADQPQSGAKQQTEPKPASTQENAGQNKNTSEDKPAKDRAANTERTRYGTGYESRRKNSLSATRQNKSGRGQRSGRSKRQR